MAKHIFADMIIAWANGAQVQAWSKCAEMWVDISEPTWNTAVPYRIKPEPKPDVMRQFFLDRSIDRWFEGCTSIGNNIKCMFDGETGKLKSVEILK